MMTMVDIKNIVSVITYKPGWGIGLYYDEDKSSAYVQLTVDEISDASLDSVSRDGTRVPWKSGKRYISWHMSRQEIVGVVFDLIKGAEMHEVHEWFRYKNASIYNPHLDPDVLVDVARKKSSYNVRIDSMTRVE